MRGCSLSAGHHDCVVAAVLGVGVIEFELLLDGAVVIGRIAFEVSDHLGGEWVVDRPRRGGRGHPAGARDTGGRISKPAAAVKRGIPIFGRYVRAALTPPIPIPS